MFSSSNAKKVFILELFKILLPYVPPSKLKISEISYEQVESAFGRFDFLIDIKKYDEKKESFYIKTYKKFHHGQLPYRIWIYNEIHNKIRNMLNSIALESYHLKLYRENESKNLCVIVDKIDKLNQMLFSIEEVEYSDKYIWKVYSAFYNDLMKTVEEYRSNIYGTTPNYSMVAPIHTIWQPKNEE